MMNVPASPHIIGSSLFGPSDLLPGWMSALVPSHLHLSISPTCCCSHAAGPLLIAMLMCRARAPLAGPRGSKLIHYGSDSNNLPSNRPVPPRAKRYLTVPVTLALPRHDRWKVMDDPGRGWLIHHLTMTCICVCVSFFRHLNCFSGF